MPLGVTVRDANQAAPTSAPTDTGQWFAAGLTDRGPAGTPVKITNLGQFTATFGPRDTGSPLYDSVEAYFREGGGAAHISRVVGPSPASSSVVLDDAGGEPAPSLTVTAATPGVWGDSLRVAVVAGSTAGLFVLVLSHVTAGELVRSPDLATTADAAAWATASATPSRYITIAATGDDDPAVVSATALTGGSDDRANITDTQWAAALDAFTRTLGPGQVSTPGRTTATGHSQLRDHAAERNRIALLDGVDTPTVSTLVDAAAAAGATDAARFAAFLGSWLTIPGLVTGTTRTIPPSPFVAALMARQDAVGTPNQPAAGSRGIARWALAPTRTFTDEQYDTLNDAGVNMARVVYDSLRLYGYRSLESKAAARWWQLSNGRLRMLIQAQLEEIGERYMFRQVDGKGVTLSTLAGEITGMLLEHHRVGALYGATPDQAFRVDVSDAVNPPEQLAAGVVNAVAVIRPAPFGEEVVIEFVRQSITEPV